ncbi:MAG: CBS domain-containing protein [Spirulina sp. DLM2.Bin59]|nr:MAG: CBS domain-containing protein [Spirulina sp. DLM2.Bin59]
MKRYLPAGLQTWLARQHFGSYVTSDHYALLEACLIGCVSAIAALLLKEGIAIVGNFRLQLITTLPQLAGRWPLSLPVFSFALCWLAGWLVETWAPDAKGGGIPQVKAALAEFPVILSIRVAVVKLLGTILILGAGLTLGRRGPTVHIGAALAAQLSQWVPTSPQHRRQMIAAGAAAGLAAGFNTPIAGVLFVVEELSRDMSGLTLETAILASFTGSVVSRLLGSAGLNLPAAMLTVNLHHHFTMREIPFYLLLGTLAGLLGVAFNRGVLASLAFNQRWRWVWWGGSPLAWRMGAVGLISGGVIAFSPPTLLNNAGLRDFLVTGGAGWRETLVIFAIHFGLTILAYGSGAPGGLFSPALVLGSALGYWVGELAMVLGGADAKATYALVGMGAFFTAVARVPITAIVIVFELTMDFQLVLPLMISTVVAYGVAETLKSGSLYQHLLEVSGIDLKDESSRREVLTDLRAGDVMQRKVETLVATMRVEDVYGVVRESLHHGFPVVDEGELVGMVTEQNLARLNSLEPEQLVREMMTAGPVTVPPLLPVGDVMYLMDRYQVSHLPVTEGRKLLGIITRSDLIHATASHLQGKSSPANPRQPSYVVYETRGPAVGKGRILLPLANPETAPSLLKIAGAIALEEGYELECLIIIAVPRHTPPAQARVDLTESHRFLAEIMAIAADLTPTISIHSQIRLAQDTAQGILETIRDRHIDRLILGWKGSTSTPGRIFGNVVDTLVQRASCEVMLIKFGGLRQSYPLAAPHGHWLIPMSGGPNIRRALHYLPAFIHLQTPAQIFLTQVIPPHRKSFSGRRLKTLAQELQTDLDCEITALVLRSNDVVASVTQFAAREACPLIILGASREGMIQQVLHGNIPEAIASQSQATVILLRAGDGEESPP